MPVRERTSIELPMNCTALRRGTCPLYKCQSLRPTRKHAALLRGQVCLAEFGALANRPGSLMCPRTIIFHAHQQLPKTGCMAPLASRSNWVTRFWVLSNASAARFENRMKISCKWSATSVGKSDSLWSASGPKMSCAPSAPNCARSQKSRRYY